MRSSIGLLLGAIMAVTAACASAPPPSPPPPPSVNVSGNWAGTWWAYDGSGGSGVVLGTFLQDGAVVRGQFEVRGPTVNTTYVEGRVVANEIRLSIPSAGTLVVIGEEMNGVVSGSVAFRVTLRKQP
jgi:hypothetical protein